MKKFFEEFKKFAMRGNVVDMAVGVVVGGAFSKIVTSLVNDVFMPVIGLLTGGKSVSGMFALLGTAPEGTVIETIEQAKELGIATLNYGTFIQTIIDFILVAFCIFLVVKFINKMKKPAPAPAPAPAPRKCPFCQSVIDEKATRCPHCTSQLSE